MQGQKRLKSIYTPTLTKKELTKLAEADWDNSCLTARDWPLPCVVWEDLSGGGKRDLPRLGGYDIQYPGPVPYARSKLLEVKLDHKGKVQKYAQPKGSPSRLFACGGVHTLGALSTAIETVFFPEGEKSGLCVFKALHEPGDDEENFRVFAVPGAWNWVDGSATSHNAPIKDIVDLKLSGKHVVIVPDNDHATKPSVQLALSRFAEMFKGQGAASVDFVDIPNVPGAKKTGADDYAKEYGLEALASLLVDPTKRFAVQPELVEMSTKFIYVEDEGVVVNRHEVLSAGVSVDTFYKRAEALKMIRVPNGKPAGDDGKLPYDLVKAGPYWINTPAYRATVHKRGFRPGIPDPIYEKQITVHGTTVTQRYLNTFTGFPYEPLEGAWPPCFWRAFCKLYPKEATRNYKLNWVRQMLVNPEEKNYTLPILLSSTQGSGKSLIELSMMKLFGPYAKKIEAKELIAEFNGQLLGVIWGFMDEFSYPRDAEARAALNEYVTSETVKIHFKGKTPYTTDSFMNFSAAANNSNALKFNSGDRRWAPINTEAPELTEDQVTELVEEMRNPIMLGRLMWNVAFSPEAVARSAEFNPKIKVGDDVIDRVKAVINSQGDEGHMVMRFITMKTQMPSAELLMRNAKYKKRTGMYVDELTTELVAFNDSKFRGTKDTLISRILLEQGIMTETNEENGREFFLFGKEAAKKLRLNLDKLADYLPTELPDAMTTKLRGKK